MGNVVVVKDFAGTVIVEGENPVPVAFEYYSASNQLLLRGLSDHQAKAALSTMQLGDAEPQSFMPKGVSQDGLEAQVARLATFIMSEIPGEPSANEGAVDTAIRLLKQQRCTTGPTVTGRLQQQTPNVSSLPKEDVQVQERPAPLCLVPDVPIPGAPEPALKEVPAQTVAADLEEKVIAAAASEKPAARSARTKRATKPAEPAAEPAAAERAPTPEPTPEAPAQVKSEPTASSALPFDEQPGDSWGIEPKPGAAAASLPADLLGELKKATRLGEVLGKLLDAGHKDPVELIRLCEDIKAGVPALARIPDLQERIPRTLDVMGVA